MRLRAVIGVLVALVAWSCEGPNFTADGLGGSGGTGGTGGIVPEGGSGGGSGLCDGKTCRYVATGTQCNEATGQCECDLDPDSCLNGLQCDPVHKVCATTGCSPACSTAGEFCEPTATGGRACICDPSDDRCVAPSTCDPTTLECVVKSPCQPPCENGDICDPTTSKCVCGPAGCDPGYLCDPTTDSCTPQLDDGGGPCGRPCPPGDECIKNPRSGTYDCLRKCDTSAECPIATSVCFKARNPLFPYCWYNFCDAAKTDNGTYFNPCDTETGTIDPSDPAPTGTCLPFGTGGTPPEIGLCLRGGTTAIDALCEPDPIAATDASACVAGGYCGLRDYPPLICKLDADCSNYTPFATGGGTCLDRFCTAVCATEDDCKSWSGTCDATLGACVQRCQVDGDCSAGHVCNADSRCIPTTCADDSACAGDTYCDTDKVCASRGLCYDLCNAGSDGTDNGEPFAGCQDAGKQCKDVSGVAAAVPYKIGFCFAP